MRPRTSLTQKRGVRKCSGMASLLSTRSRLTRPLLLSHLGDITIQTGCENHMWEELSRRLASVTSARKTDESLGSTGGVGFRLRFQERTHVRWLYKDRMWRKEINVALAASMRTQVATMAKLRFARYSSSPNCAIATLGLKQRNGHKSVLWHGIQCGRGC